MINRIVRKANCIFARYLHHNNDLRKAYNALLPMFAIPTEGIDPYENETEGGRYTGYEMFRSQARRLTNELSISKHDDKKPNLRITWNTLLILNVFTALEINQKEFIDEIRNTLTDEMMYSVEDSYQDEYDDILDRLDKIEKAIEDKRNKTILLENRVEFLHMAIMLLINNPPKNNSNITKYILWQQIIKYIPTEKRTRSKLLNIYNKLYENESCESGLSLLLTYAILTVGLDIFEKYKRSAKKDLEKTTFRIIFNITSPEYFGNPIERIVKGLRMLSRQYYSFIKLIDTTDKNQLTDDFDIFSNTLLNDIAKLFAHLLIDIDFEIIKRKQTIKDLQSLFRNLWTYLIMMNIADDAFNQFNKEIQKIKTQISEYYDKLQQKEIKKPELNPEQQEAVYFVKNTWKNKKLNNHLQVPIIALNMGSGKTRVACAIIQEFYLERKETITSYILIVAPAGLLHNWQKELKAVGMTNVVQLIDYRRKDHYQDNSFKYIEGTCYLISYDTIANDIEYFLHDSPSLLVYDELQEIINGNRIQDRAFQLANLNKGTKYIFALTGTPAQNTTIDFFVSYCFFYDKKLLEQYRGKSLSEADWKNKEDFNRIKIILKENKFYLFGSFEYDFDICTRITPVLISKDIFDNYNRLSTYKISPITRAQYILCPQAMKKNKESIPLQNLNINLDIDSPKITFVSKLLDSIPKDDNMVIFSKYTEPLIYLKEKLQEHHPLQFIKNDTLETTVINDADPPSLFKEGSNAFLTTLQKGGTGLNLQEANHLVILDLWWNPMVILQAISRIIRINQKKDVFIYLPMYIKQRGDPDVQFWEPDISIYKKIEEKNETINQFLRDIGYEKGCRKLPNKVSNYLFSIEDSAEENHLFETLRNAGSRTMTDFKRGNNYTQRRAVQ